MNSVLLCVSFVNFVCLSAGMFLSHLFLGWDVGLDYINS